VNRHGCTRSFARPGNSARRCSLCFSLPWATRLPKTKEGVTVFKLDTQEQRKAALMSRPGSDGSNAFARFLTTQAVYRDLARLPPLMRQPGTVQFFLNAPHDNACVLATMDELLSAMLAHGPTGAQLN